MANHITFPASPQQIVDFIGEAVHKQCRVLVSYSNHTGETYNWSDLKFNPYPENGYPLKIIDQYYLPDGHNDNRHKPSILGMRLTKNWR